MLFQIDGDVESVCALADLLSSASPNSSIGLNHSTLGNTKFIVTLLGRFWALHGREMI